MPGLVADVPTYKVDTSQSKMLVQARSKIHDTTSTFDRISGTVEATPDTLKQGGQLPTSPSKWARSTRVTG